MAVADALVNGTCVASTDASALLWSSVPPSLDASGTVMVQPDGAGGYVWQRWESGALVASAAMPAPVFAECSRAADAADGVALGFGVIAVWAAVFGVMVLKRALA